MAWEQPVANRRTLFRLENRTANTIFTKPRSPMRVPIQARGFAVA